MNYLASLITLGLGLLSPPPAQNGVGVLMHSLPYQLIPQLEVSSNHAEIGRNAYNIYHASSRMRPFIDMSNTTQALYCSGQQNDQFSVCDKYTANWLTHLLYQPKYSLIVQSHHFHQNGSSWVVKPWRVNQIQYSNVNETNTLAFSGAFCSHQGRINCNVATDRLNETTFLLSNNYTLRHQEYDVIAYHPMINRTQASQDYNNFTPFQNHYTLDLRVEYGFSYQKALSIAFISAFSALALLVARDTYHYRFNMRDFQAAFRLGGIEGMNQAELVQQFMNTPVPNNMLAHLGLPQNQVFLFGDPRVGQALQFIQFMSDHANESPGQVQLLGHENDD